MDRRGAVLALASLGVVPRAALAQQRDRVWRVGVLHQGGRQSAPGLSDQTGLRQGLREVGYVEGRNLVLEWRFAELDALRLKSYAEELVRLKVDLIVTSNTTSTHAAQKASTTVPIVMSSSGDPVGSGFASTLARPGGNITGLSNLSADLGAKLLEMLLAMVPGLARVAVLVNPANTGNVLTLANIQAAAQVTRTRILPFEVRSAKEFETAFAGIVRERAQALIALREGLFGQHARAIAERARDLRLPLASGNPQSTETGGLLAYAPVRTDAYRRVAMYADRIFKGAKPGELAIEQPTQFQLVVNVKTAHALGLAVPQAILIRADRVIE